MISEITEDGNDLNIIADCFESSYELTLSATSKMLFFSLNKRVVVVLRGAFLILQRSSSPSSDASTAAAASLGRASNAALPFAASSLHFARYSS